MVTEPTAFLEAVRSGAPTHSEVLVEDAAVADWIVRKDGGAALKVLAADLRFQHKDDWMSDFLRAPRVGAMALAAAVRANIAGDHAKALSQARKAAVQFRHNNRAGWLRAEREEAYALQRQFLGEECARVVEGAKTELAGLRYSWLRGELDLELAACRNILGRVGAAAMAAERAATEAREADYPSMQLRAMSFAGGFHINLGNPDALWKETLEGLDLFWSRPYRSNRGFNLILNLTLSAERNNQRWAAYITRGEAVGVLDGDPNLPLRALSHARLASAALEAGERQVARREHAVAEQLFDRLGDPQAALEHRTEAQMMDVLAAAQDQPSSGLAPLLSFAAGHPTMPTALLDARFHTDLGGLFFRLDEHGEAEREFAAGLERYDRIRSRAAADRGLAVSRESAGAYRGLANERINQHGDWIGASEIWDRFRGGAAPATLDSRHETFLVFAELPSGIARWVISGDRIEGDWVKATPEELHRTAARFLAACSNPNSRDWQIDARSLYDWLVLPVENRLASAEPIVVIADGSTTLVPFAALMDSTGRFLGSRFATISAESRSIYLAGAKRAPIPISRLNAAVVFADPSLRGAMRQIFPPLKEAHREAMEIARVFPRHYVYEGDAARVNALEDASQKAEIFHFAGHGVSNAGWGGLMLAGGVDAEAEVIDATRLSHLNWRRCRLVVLSACSTGSGAAWGAMSPEGLVRGFLTAGASRVVAARWPIDSIATADFMEQFYRVLGKGAEPSAALQTAAFAIRSGAAHPAYASEHPYYWAGFDIFGFR